MPGFGEHQDGGDTPQQLRDQGDFLAGEALVWFRDAVESEEKDVPGSQLATISALLAVYCEIRRLTNLMPTGEDIRAHTSALETHSTLMADHIQAMERYCRSLGG